MNNSCNNRQKGATGEDKAAAFLMNHQMRIMERNYRTRRGEIDIIGKHEGYLVFVEVKSRTTLRKGMPEEAVTLSKQRTICRTADFYRINHGYPDTLPIRYDVLAITGENITWYQNAFPHIYAR
jgi:putative endonuclease